MDCRNEHCNTEDVYAVGSGEDTVLECCVNIEELWHENTNTEYVHRDARRYNGALSKCIEELMQAMQTGNYICLQHILADMKHSGARLPEPFPDELLEWAT